ncbi:enhanced serine sensitivity protein SseB C-terminal domain-containing protein [Allostreptomyces psammosilenae]|uniref:Enhanced serine sensitivity protein SseB n=1 Tax=Allostreptomyces psammosilenae TaxID=1892865 RepID=A0A853A0S6_9ACTN|nr:enhanced serine sensitivity protein SseB C-terminal domain-containing protein [Allostreptomyces psammosilenae]NYI06534.1 hypothetical protein [Allostreptomyces psammosilenae]
MAFPENELEHALVAALGNPHAVPDLVEVLSRSPVWVPLPGGPGPGGSPGASGLNVPTTRIGDGRYVPVFSSDEQFRRAAGGMAGTLAPAWEFARGLPPDIGMVINPGGEVGIPLPPEAVLDVARARRPDPYAGPVTGGRVRMWVPDPREDPVEFVAKAAGELALVPVVRTARRALARVEQDAPMLFVAVEMDRYEPEDQVAATNALGRALGVAPVPWGVSIVLPDVAQDPVGEWLRDMVAPFYVRP